MSHNFCQYFPDLSHSPLKIHSKNFISCLKRKTKTTQNEVERQGDFQPSLSLCYRCRPEGAFSLSHHLLAATTLILYLFWCYEIKFLKSYLGPQISCWFVRYAFLSMKIGDWLFSENQLYFIKFGEHFYETIIVMGDTHERSPCDWPVRLSWAFRN